MQEPTSAPQTPPRLGTAPLVLSALSSSPSLISPAWGWGFLQHPEPQWE